jgi:hypothetical protein
MLTLVCTAARVPAQSIAPNEVRVFEHPDFIGQDVEEAPPSAGFILHAKNPLPPQFMLRASSYLYLDADAGTDATSDQTESNAEESTSAQAAEQGASPAPKTEEPGQSTQPSPSRLERWHPEAFVDPTAKPEATKPALTLELDSADLKVTPTAPQQTQKKERSRGAKAGIAVGVILGVGLVGFGIGAAVAVSNMEF